MIQQELVVSDSQELPVPNIETLIKKFEHSSCQSLQVKSSPSDLDSGLHVCVSLGVSQLDIEALMHPVTSSKLPLASGEPI